MRHHLKMFARIIAAALISISIGGCKKADSDRRIEAADNEQCSFSHSALSGNHCRISIYAAIVDPDKYVGKKILTYGFISFTKEGSLLVPRSDQAGVMDSISCIYMERFENGTGNNNPVRQPGLYSVEIAGTLQPARRNVCAASLDGAVIIDSTPESAAR